MKVEPGVRLGPYEILAPIGAGGMGEVFRARDTRLDRIVAVKVLPEALAGNVQLRQRFEREAKAISALAHPHICVLFDVGNEGSVEYLVMEHLEGETLADRIARGPLPVEEALRYAIEIADALEKAHRRGIIHRDLKPGNVMLTKSGTKLLDFGLARAMEMAPSSADSVTAMVSENHPPITAEGTIVGTYQYMAPEQLEGRPVDARGDIFAFGALLYEMLAGKRAFDGKSRASIIAAILAVDPPPVSAIRPLTPSGLDRLVRICLSKDPDERYQTAHDVKLELERIAAEPEGRSVARGKDRGKTLAWGIAALMALLAISLAWLQWRRSHQPGEVLRFAIPPPPNEQYAADASPGLLSPDGRSLVVRTTRAKGAGGLLIWRYGSLGLQEIAGTDDAYDPFWSSDGRWLGIFQDGKLKKLNLSASTITTLLSVGDSRGGAWGPGGEILFAPNPAGPIMRTNESGAPPRPVTTLDKSRGETGHWRPQFLPDGRHFLYVAYSSQPEKGGVYVGDLDSPQVKRVLDMAVTTIAAPTGHLLYIVDSNLFAQPFDFRKLETTGEAVAIAQHVEYAAQWGAPGFSVANAGTLAYNLHGNAPASQLAAIDDGGVTTSIPFDGFNLDLSRDDTRLAMQRRGDATGIDIWTWELARGVGTRVTFDEGDEIGPVWSPDGRRLAYVRFPESTAIVHICQASGGDDRVVLKAAMGAEVVDWSRDGRYLLLEVFDPVNKADLATIDLTAAAPAITPFVSSPFMDNSGRFSPDGKWIAYFSNLSGQGEIYVQPFPPDGSRVQVSIGGGDSPRWRGDGRQLYYVSRDRSIMAVDLDVHDGIHPSPPHKLVSIGTIDYVVNSSGKQFITSTMNGGTTEPVVVVLNWPNLLKQ